MTIETQFRLLRISGTTAVIAVFLGAVAPLVPDVALPDQPANILSAQEQELSCLHPNQNAAVGQTVNYRVASPSSLGSYVWKDILKGDVLATGPQFSTSYSSAGAYQVQVVSGDRTATCTTFVNVTTIPPTPSPTPTPAPASTKFTCLPKLQTIHQKASASFSVIGDVPNKKITWYTSAGKPHSGVGNSFVSTFSKRGLFFVAAYQAKKSSICKVRVVK